MLPLVPDVSTGCCHWFLTCQQDAVIGSWRVNRMLPLVPDVSTGCWHWFLTRPRWTFFTPTESVPSGSITILWYYSTILSYHLHLSHPNDLFPSGCPPEPCTHLPPFPWCRHVPLRFLCPTHISHGTLQPHKAHISCFCSTSSFRTGVNSASHGRPFKI